MTATDELRRLLEERGVEHTDLGGMTEWTNGRGRICRAYTRNEPLTVDIAILAVPPAQAIAATLGGGTCRITASSTDGLTSDEPKQWFELSCGHAFKLYGLDAPVACPVCGKAVKR